ncbi:MAG TPA: hypothetical protein VF613_11590 [Longimicrobium sp.]|jgi:hypothetical protein
MSARLRSLAPPLYLLALLMCVVPLVDLVAALRPYQLGSAHWRYGAIGLLGNALMLPLAGLVIATATAVLLEHTRTRRALAYLSLAGAAMLLVTMGDFTLDALQIRTSLPGEVMTRFAFASALSLLKQAFGLALLASIGVGQLRALRGRKTAAQSAEPMPLLATATA